MPLSEALSRPQQDGSSANLDISPAALRATQEADQALSPDIWASNYPGLPGESALSPAWPPPTYYLPSDVWF